MTMNYWTALLEEEALRAEFQALEPLSEDYVDLPLEKYKMDADPRGYCFLIDNHNFWTSEGQLSPREGSKFNTAPLKRSFEKLRFSVETKEVLNSDDFKECMKEYSEKDHTLFDCFVCCISSHGNKTSVKGVYPEIGSYFSARNCPSLAGKPKLFFISTFQGDKHVPAISIPCEADFVLSFTTVLNYVSYRDRISGTYYLEELAKVLDKYGNSEDMHDLLTRVNDAVSRRYPPVNYEGNCPMPSQHYTLRKKLFF